MIVLDSGHDYLLDSIDGELENRLTFVKREGQRYPGNVGAHPGTTMQEVLRALIDRARFVNNPENFSHETQRVEYLLCEALMLLEERAARLHGRPAPLSTEDVVQGRGKCPACGHCGCDGACRPHHQHPQESVRR